jgi:4-oxalomesaconate tautomerase
VRIRMLNSGGIAVAQVQTPGGKVSYDGDAKIDGVPGTAASVMIDFADVAGSNCGALLPTGKVVDEIDGVELTCIDNGMPVVLLRASDFGKTGYESPEELEADETLKAHIESIRLQAGPMMNLGDVAEKTVPKMSLIAPAQHGGVVATRTFIPHRVHQSIGVLGAASVAAACCIPGSVAEGIVTKADDGELDVEHPSGRFTVAIEISKQDGGFTVTRSALLRTARKLMDGNVYVPEGNASC